MGTLYLDRKSTTLERTGAVLTVRHGDTLTRIPLVMLDRIVVLCDMPLPASLLPALSEAGITLSVIGHRQRFAHVAAAGPGDVQRLLDQVRCFEQVSVRAQLARLVVRLKLRAHLRVLGRLLSARPDQRLTLFKARQRLTDRLRDCRDPSVTIDSLRGIEGAAARDWFAAFATVLPPALGFSGRNRRDPVNAVLSLGYTLLHGEAIGALAAAGLEPRLGFLHDPAWGRASLAADLIEPQRAKVDELVWQLCRDRQLDTQHFSRDGPGVLLGKEGRGVFFPAFETLLRTLRPQLRRHAVQLVKLLHTRQNGTRQSATPEQMP
jgi:CRISPR-associated protein Cas1